MKSVYQEKLKRNNVLDRLRDLNITHTKQGQPIEALGYASLKRELAIAAFREQIIR
ncbi:hypothetical protein [Bacillus cihuensis]|uniref:hypothetical protein n=1 Tax=Bacillus cihuensis TaxID=1208599 RepID=UPI00041DAAB8|nr:hypothetical protein [Bacillus cihuensis]